MGSAASRFYVHDDDSDDDIGLGFELEQRLANQNAHAAIDMPQAVPAPEAGAGLFFGGNIFQGVGNEVPPNSIAPLLRRLVDATPNLSQTKTLRSDVNINKASIKLLPVSSESTQTSQHKKYALSFQFDATSPCIVKVFYCVDEIFTNELFEYRDSEEGKTVGQIPSSIVNHQSETSLDPSLLFKQQDTSPKNSHSSRRVISYIEKKFGAGLGQLFQTSDEESLDISQYSLSQLLWNQLEQQLVEDDKHKQADISDKEDQDNENELEDESLLNRTASTEDASLEDDGNTSSENDTATSSDRRNSRTSSRSRRNRRKKNKKLPAAPRPKLVSGEPTSARSLYPIVISIEPLLNQNSPTKNYLAAQITHLTLTQSPQKEASDEVSIDLASTSDPLAPSSSSAPEDDLLPSSSSSSSSTNSDLKFSCKIIRQKILVNGNVYNVYDIFGVDQQHPSDQAVLDGTYSGQTECVICMTDPKNTLVIPCRHMCLCEACADTLKVQSVKCPICRGPVRSLLKIDISTEDDDEPEDKQDNDEEDEEDDEHGEEIALVRRSKTNMASSQAPPRAERHEATNLGDSAV